MQYCMLHVAALLIICIIFFFCLKLASCDKKFNASSPGAFSLYASSSKQDCKYDIWASSSRGVRLTWGGFNIKGKMPDCSDDYVEIFIGCGRHSIGKYCSENGNKPFDVYSRDGCLRIKFRSYRSSSFTATYSSFSLSTGNNNLLMDTFGHPNFFFVCHRPTDPIFLKSKTKFQMQCLASKILILN